jgi:hypothetical protein
MGGGARASEHANNGLGNLATDAVTGEEGDRQLASRDEAPLHGRRERRRDDGDLARRGGGGGQHTLARL